MEVVDSIEALRKARAGLRGTVGVIPTMGALHGGHRSLVDEARAEHTNVIVTIFINPMQFAPGEDLAAYPRDLPGDLKLLEAAGVDLIFTPTPDLIYPPGYQTYIDVETVTEGLEGSHRPGHFRGVATVVSKLFHLTMPDTAYFGQKDAQQVAVIRRMVHDLNFPLNIAIVPTIREPDGLAMSSRNTYLTPEQRAAAPVLYQALQAAGTAYASGERQPNNLQTIMRQILAHEPQAVIDYVSIDDAQTLHPVNQPTDKPMLLSMAVKIGRTRLIDNGLLPLALNTRPGLEQMLGNPEV
ncbi:MAG: pantoate--beta-alanine ligase [Anaerolineae bacterium]|nr:pantoate--beta-alanine ligase [Anaerolineae bacterium]